NTQAIFFKTDPTGQEQVQVTSMSRMKSNIYGLRGLTYQAMGDYDRAMIDLDRAIWLDSTSQNVMNRALLHKELGELDLAAAQLKLAVQLQPSNEVAWFNLVILDDAVELPDAIKAEADFGPMLAYRAVEAFEEANYEEAEALFRQALVLNPDDPSLLLNAGRLDIKQGQLEEAKRKFLVALSMDETRLETYYLMGNAFFREKAFEEAAAFYDQFLLRDRSNSKVWYNAAMAYFELQDLKSACQYLQEASVRGMQQADKYLQSKCNQ
ncbi:MAG: tetratricopeptide repeat protein, partial [Bacteroidota bacterium]